MRYMLVRYTAGKPASSIAPTPWMVDAVSRTTHCKRNETKSTPSATIYHSDMGSPLRLPRSSNLPCSPSVIRLPNVT